MLPPPVHPRFTARDGSAPTLRGAREWEPRGFPRGPVTRHHRGDQGRRLGLVRCCLWEAGQSLPCTDRDGCVGDEGRS